MEYGILLIQSAEQFGSYFQRTGIYVGVNVNRGIKMKDLVSEVGEVFEVALQDQTAFSRKDTIMLLALDVADVLAKYADKKEVSSFLERVQCPKNIRIL